MGWWIIPHAVWMCTQNKLDFTNFKYFFGLFVVEIIVPSRSISWNMRSYSPSTYYGTSNSSATHFSKNLPIFSIKHSVTSYTYFERISLNYFTTSLVYCFQFWLLVFLSILRKIYWFFRRIEKTIWSRWFFLAKILLNRIYAKSQGIYGFEMFWLLQIIPLYARYRLSDILFDTDVCGKYLLQIWI